MMTLVLSVGVLTVGIGLTLVAFSILDARDEIIRLRQDVVTVMQRQTKSDGSADVGAYMERQLREQGRWREEAPCEPSD